MSINVNVTGNPICIKRGSVLISDSEQCAKEFERRRLLRLEQVRQQSKDIAQTVRENVRKEQNRLVSNNERKNSAKLKERQNQKKDELQDRYREYVAQIGTGHAQAVAQQCEDDEIFDCLEKEQEKADDRGKQAVAELQIQKDEDELLKQMTEQHRKLVRAVEDNRAAIVIAKGKKNVGRKKIKRPSTSMNITVGDNDDIHVDVSTKRSKTPKKKKSKKGSAHLISLYGNTPPPSLEYNSPELSDFDVNISPKKSFSHRKSSDRSPSPPSLRIKGSKPSTTRSRSPKPSTSKSRSPKASTSGLRSPRASTSKSRSPKASTTSKPKSISPAESSLELGSPEPETRISELIRKRIEKMQEELQKPMETTSTSEDSPRVSPHKKCTCSCLCAIRKPICVCCCCCGRYPAPAMERSPLKSVSNLSRASPPPPITLTSLRTTAKENRAKSRSPRSIRLPTRPKIGVRSSRLTAPTSTSKFTKVRHYDRNNMFSEDRLQSAKRSEKIPSELLEILSPETESESITEHRALSQQRVAQERGKTALAKEMVSRENKELLGKLGRLQGRERAASLDHSKDVHHMNDERLKEHDEKRKSRLEDAFERLFPNAVTLQPKQHAVEEPQVPFRAVSVGDSDPVVDKATKWYEQAKTPEDDAQNLRQLLDKLKGHKEMLEKEVALDKQDSESLSKLISDLECCICTENARKGRSPMKKVSTGKLSASRKRSKSLGRQKVAKTKPTRVERLILQNTSTQTSPNIVQPTTKESKTSTSSSTSSGASTDKLCEIVIKLADDKPNVFIKEPKTGETKPIQEYKPKSQESGDYICPKTCPKVPKEAPSKKRAKEDSNGTTSTAYYSPPDYTKPSTKMSSTKDLLPQKPQLPPETSNKNIDPKLLTYIRKLLSMSKASVDNLQVSTVSEVSTPNSSVVGHTSDTSAQQQLKNVLKFFNLSARDVTDGLREMSSSRSRSTRSSVSSNNTDARAVSFSDYRKEKYPGIVDKYSELAEVCIQRINNLEEMIKKVRHEKAQMLSPGSSASDKDISSTQYLNLPPNSEDGSRSTSPEQVALTKKLLEVNVDKIDEDLLKRYRALLNDATSPSPVLVKDEDKKERVEDAYVPLFLQIPKLPPLDRPVSKKPPPSKGLSVVKRYNDNITNVPHELSTITEADSRNRSRSPIEVSPAPLPVVLVAPQPEDVISSGDTSSKGKSSEDSLPDLVTDSSGKKSPNNQSPCPTNDPLALNALAARVQELTSDSSSEMSEFDVERMLKSMGMEWAIATLRKTKAALEKNQSSSSSSIELSKNGGTPVGCKAKGRRSSTPTSTSKNTSVSFQRELVEISEIQQQRTSTPVQSKSSERTKDGSKDKYFSEDGSLSSVKK